MPAALALILAATLPGAAHADQYAVHLSCPALISLPTTEALAPRVFVRPPAGTWMPLPAIVAAGSLRLSLDPGKLGGGQAQLLINPPPGIDINDANPPYLSALILDGRRFPADSLVTLAAAATFPKHLTLVAHDAESDLDAASLQVTLDGKPVAPTAPTGPSSRALTASVRLPSPALGPHVIRYSLADASPQANRLEGEIAFARYDMTDRVIRVHGTTLAADSYFPTYPSLDALQDGVTALPGDTLPNANSWASTEDPVPHWVQATFSRPRTIRQVTIYWANYTREFHTSRCFEVQVPEGTGWKTLYRSPAAGEPEAVSTTVTFEPQQTQTFRVWQPAGQGSATRPNLMWLAEIEAR
jgi:hypothetical protein